MSAQVPDTEVSIDRLQQEAREPPVLDAPPAPVALGIGDAAVRAGPSFSLRTSWFIGAASWASAVSLAFDDAGVWRGASAAFALFLVWLLALATATLAGTSRFPRGRALAMRAIGILLAGSTVVLLTIFVTSAMTGSQKVTAILVAMAAIPLFFLANRAFFRWSREHARPERLASIVRRLVWTTLLFTTAVSSVEPRFLVERMRHHAERSAGRR